MDLTLVRMSLEYVLLQRRLLLHHVAQRLLVQHHLLRALLLRALLLRRALSEVHRYVRLQSRVLRLLLWMLLHGIQRHLRGEWYTLLSQLLLVLILYRNLVLRQHRLLCWLLLVHLHVMVHWDLHAHRLLQRLLLQEQLRGRRLLLQSRVGEGCWPLRLRQRWYWIRRQLLLRPMPVLHYLVPLHYRLMQGQLMLKLCLALQRLF